jgi:hypothetical protein
MHEKDSLQIAYRLIGALVPVDILRLLTRLRKWMKKVFKDSLEQSATLVRQQLEAVKDKRGTVAVSLNR